MRILGLAAVLVLALVAVVHAPGAGAARPDPCANPTVEVEPAPPGQPTYIFGTRGNDVIRGTVGRDVVYANAGDDIVCGLGGDDELHGGSGDDVVYGDGGNDVLAGDRGKDHLLGGPGIDELYGHQGADRCEPGSKRERVELCERVY